MSLTKQLGNGKGLFKLNPFPTGKQIIGNEAILAVLSSSILSPMLVPTITSYIAKLPYVSTHVTIAAAIPAILLFRIGVSMSNRTLGALILGVAGSFVLAAVLPFVSPILNRVKA
jgi:hypothetical protein